LWRTGTDRRERLLRARRGGEIDWWRRMRLRFSASDCGTGHDDRMLPVSDQPHAFLAAEFVWRFLRTQRPDLNRHNSK